ncbi:hypothetical protein C3E97_023870 [Pseudomonas sp. MWU12-2115]|nr:hypothetical protein C3E97_023870 [Pseudomonas sp. MWU12-2115]
MRSCLTSACCSVVRPACSALSR